MFTNELQTALEFQYSLVSSLIDSGGGLVLSIWFVYALGLNSENILFIIAKLKFLVVVGLVSLLFIYAIDQYFLFKF